MAISQIAEVHERSVYTGTIMAVSQIVGIGATPFLLGAIADIWSFQLGLVFLGCLTLCLCPIITLLRKI
jgi:MFS family permease